MAKCLSLSTAGQIVQNAVPGGPHPMDKTLEEVGLISDDQRAVFQEHCYDGVLDAGCHINKSSIPADADTKLREVRQFLADNAT